MGITAQRIGLEGADLADDIGLAGVTISQVARRLGVQVPSLYAHVSGSDELMLRIAEVSLGELADRAAMALAGRSGRDALESYADAVRDFARAHPGRYDATRQRVIDESPAARDVIEAGRRHSDLIAAVLRGYSAEGDEAVHATRLLGATVHGFVSLELAGSFDHSEPDAEQSWRRALAHLDSALIHGTLGS